MILLLLLFILFSIYFKYKSYNINLYPYIVILLILYAGLRYEYGIDYNNYLIHFNEINSIFDVIHTIYEKGYSLLLFCLKEIGFGFNTILLIIAFLSIKMKSTVIKKLSVFPEVSLLIYLLLFYVLNDVEQIRYGLSIGFCFYSITFMLEEDKKSKIYSFLLIILGILFHYSAVLFIPIYFIKDKRFNYKLSIFLLASALILSMVDFRSLLVSLNDSFFQLSYLEMKLEAYKVDAKSLISATLIVKVFILFVFYKFAFNEDIKLHRILLNTYFLGVIYTCLFISIPILSARGTGYMRFMEVLMIPIYMNSIKKVENKKIHYLILIIIFTYYFFKFLEVITNAVYFNYQSI